MKQLISIFSVLVVSLNFAQTYNNPGGTISTCSGTFYDTGGAGSGPTDNEFVVTTFCASTPGDQIQINFTTFSVEDTWDFLDIFDGPNTGSPYLGFATGNGGFTVTSTSGCLTFAFDADDFASLYPGWVGIISCISAPSPADYIHPTVGINDEFVGSCLINDCGPFTYTDNGGSGGNYSNNIGDPTFGGIYRTFCPSIAGNCMQATFNEFVTQPTNDYLTIGNGPTQNSTLFTTAPANGAGRISGSPAVPFTYTSTDASGCLTFRFRSNGNTTAAGWNATLQCIPCAGGPNGTDNNDCQTMTPLCSGASISTNSSGPGIIAEGCTGSTCPAGGENHTNWYTFQAQTTGTLNITLVPTLATDDYDFAVFGPNVTCGALGSPIRCTDSAMEGTTGTTGLAGDNIEDVSGDGFLQTLNVIAGQQYILAVDKWSPSGGIGYTLSFGGSASLDCIVLPVELSEFTVEYQPNEHVIDLFWKTESERINDRWEVEKSTDGVNFEIINILQGAGTTNNESQYFTIDQNPSLGVNYYRLNQWDTDGNSKYSEIRAVNVLDDVYDMISVFPNPTTGFSEIIFNAYKKEEVILNVVSYDGKIIVNTPIQAVKGGNQLDLDLSNHGKGVYFVSIITSNKTFKTKIIRE